MMTENDLQPLMQGFDKRSFSIVSLQDEIKVDKLCYNLLRHFHQYLINMQKLQPEQAGELCHGADFFLREFVIGDRHQNLFNIDPDLVHQFAGHWYIIRTPDPNLNELSMILKGTSAFYEFLTAQGLFNHQTQQEIARQGDKMDYFQQRIDDFWAIEGDGFEEWRRACPLEPVPDIT